MRRILHIILAILSCNNLIAQEEFVEPSRFITKFQFSQLTGGVVLLQGRFDNYPDTLNFILDTGSGGISLDSMIVEYFGEKGLPSNKTIRGIAGIRNVSFLNNRKLHLKNLTIDSLNFHINNYDILTAVYGERIDGIIGYSVLSRYIVKLNYDSSSIEFWTKGSLKYPKGGFLLKPLITTLPIVEGRVRDGKQVSSRFLFDIGAGLNLMLSSEFVKDSLLLKRNKKLYFKEAEGLGGKIDLQVTVLKEFKVGPYKFKKVPVEIFDDVYNVTSYPYLGGLIGNDILRRFNTIINYSQRDIHITPNSHFLEPFDYAYSGISLYYIDGSIIIGDVSKGSPAEKAGLLEGDVVVAINKNFSQNLQTYKQSLQSAGNMLRIVVLRNGVLLDFNFRVRSIL
ncbi:MAG TPA: aspartyl protease family protein [Flavisolibacter sp.]|nr:aspartyl protease family protein [Flavisolibacter sp.]